MKLKAMEFFNWALSRIAVKVIGGVLLLIMLGSFLFNWITVVEEGQFLYEQIDAQGRTISAISAISCVEALLVRDYPVLETFATLLLREHQGINFIRIERENGELVTEIPKGASTDSAVRKTSRIYTNPILADAEFNSAIGKVIVGLSTQQVETIVSSRIHTLIRSMVMSSLMIVVLLLILLQKIVVTPIQRLERAVSQTNPDDLGTAIPFSGNDEVSRLGGAFNQMRSRLELTSKENSRIRNFLSNIINSMPSVLICVDPQDTITHWNAAAQRLTGVAIEDAVGQPLLKVFPRIASDMERVRAAIQAQTVRSVLRRSYNENGETRYEDVTIYPLVANGVEGAVIRADDVTERVRLEEMMVQSEKMVSVGQLAGGVAHDFNNLLQAILGYGEMALEESDESGAIREELEEVIKAAHRAKTLVRQLLAFSRKQVLELEDMNLAGVLSDLAKMIRRVIGEHIAFTVHSEPGMKSIHADKGQIEQILMNLCVNARDAMGEGGTLTLRTGSIELDEEFCRTNTWAKPGQFVVLSVTDTGCGMDEETQRQIFEPFFTTKELGRGTGLGLSTVFGIVRQHNGMVHVYSEVGVGSTFRIYLPMIEGTEATHKETEIEPPPGGTETILVADDDEGVRGVAEAMLRKAGYTVLTAGDGEEAIWVFDEHADGIDMALLDVVMPKLGGKAVSEHILKHRPETPFLFASGYSTDTVHTDFVQNKDIPFIQKPYQRNALLRRVRDVLDDSKN